MHHPAEVHPQLSCLSDGVLRPLDFAQTVIETVQVGVDLGVCGREIVPASVGADRDACRTLALDLPGNLSRRPAGQGHKVAARHGVAASLAQKVGDRGRGLTGRPLYDRLIDS